ncbi:hypothetical protein RB195_006162 [Necator americanus]|uniref:Uncharacterized protein n=1 Tax=Necator americanus TaxID=51031 RepID=A0ABR1BR87_NECAM
MSLRILFLLSAIAFTSYGSRCKFRESRVNEQVIRVPRNCRGKAWMAGEEYWSSVGYDGRLKDGRTTNDFLTFPQSGGGQVRDGWVAYWITKSRYGQGVHYEVFGHAYVRSDGRVCAWFAGRDRDAIELCEGFRVLSRSRTNPNEEVPFEWVLAGYARPRESIGFHHHRIAKYEWSAEDVFYGDANLRERTFRGVSPNSRFFNELTAPDQFIRKVWVLRRKPEAVAALEATESRAPYYPRYEARGYPQRYGPSFPRGDEAMRGYLPEIQGAASQSLPAIGEGAQPGWPRRPAAQERRDERVRPDHRTASIGSEARPDHRTASVGSGVRSGWPYSGRQSDIPTDVESDVDSRTDSVGGEVQPDWRRLEGREEQRRVDVEPSHRHGHRPHVTHVVKPTDPNEILADTEQIESSQERPEWPARPAAQERQEEEKEAETTPPSQPREPVRFRYVKPPVILTDQHGRRYQTKQENGQTFYYADPHIQEATADRSEQRGADTRQTPDVEGWRPVESQTRPDHDHRHAQAQDRQTYQEHLRQMQDYEARRRAHHEEYRRQLEQRRLEAQRRRAEEEKRRAEQFAREEERRRQEEERYREVPEVLDLEGGLSQISPSQTEVNDNSGEISEYPERLPPPRPLSKEEVENDVV